MSSLSDLVTTLAVTLGLAGAPSGPTVQGYVEGEYLRVAAPVAGTLERLLVSRGQTVADGTPLFALDRTTAQAERDRAAAALAQARATLDDLRKGRRPEELTVIAAQKSQAEAALRYSQAQLRRQETLARHSVNAEDQLDAARTAHDRDLARLAELTAQWQVATLPARPDQIAAAEQAVAQAVAALTQAERRLAELAPTAPTDALVEDTLFNPGEWVPANAPVVSLLPPARVKLVFFVPEPLLTRVRPEGTVGVRCDGCPPGLTALVTYRSPRAEYTPPVIYSVGSREKLVFRVEARPNVPDALAPGLPVDVDLAP